LSITSELIMDKDDRQRGFSGISGLVSDLTSLEDAPLNSKTESESRDDKGRIEPKLGAYSYSDSDSSKKKNDNASVSSNRVNKSETTSKSSQKKSSSTHQVNSSKSKSKDTYPSDNKNESGNSGKWIFVIIGVVFLIWLFNQVDGPSNTTRSSPPSNYSPSIPKPSPTQTHDRTAKPGINYQIPLVGRNKVLSITEIRWCIKEGVRIGAMRNVNTTQRGIDRFNRIVDDYNNRCGKYRYKQGILSRAKRDVEPFRSQIVAEAVREAKGYDNTFTPSYTEKPSTQRITSPSYSAKPSIPQKTSSSKKPSVTLTREAQQLLTNLGYKPGPIDGLYGRKTSEAIKAFQQNVGIKVDGWVDQDILNELRRSIKKNRSLAIQKIPTKLTKQTSTSKKLAANTSIKSVSSFGNIQNISSTITTSEREQIEGYCSRMNSTPGDEYNCITRELGKLKKIGGRPSLSGITRSEREQIEGYCSRMNSTPGDEYNCIKRELGKLKQTGGSPNLSGITRSEREQIEGYCSRMNSTPGDEYNCITRELGKLKKIGGRPSLSGITRSEREQIEGYCSRMNSTPGDEYNCITRELGKLKKIGGSPSLSGITRSEREQIEGYCSRMNSTPGDEYNCINRELMKLKQLR
jgi:hypothetical protein